MIHRGRLIHERYGGTIEHWDRDDEPVNATTPLLSWSMAKAIITKRLMPSATRWRERLGCVVSSCDRMPADASRTRRRGDAYLVSSEP